MDYGLWLLIALLVLIALLFLLSGKRKGELSSEPATPPADVAPAPLLVDPVPVEAVPVAPIPVEPVAVAPLLVEPVVQVVPDLPEPAPEPTAAPEPTPAPVAIPVSPSVAAPGDDGDDLLRLKGVGPKLKALLIELGVTRYAHIAAWTETDIAAIDGKLGTFRGRPVRDHWVDQAKYLAAGDIAGFEAKYGKL